MVETPSLSNIGSHVVPALVVFQTPPEAVPTYTVLGLDSTTAKSSIRPPMMAGPSSRHCRSSFSAAGAAAAGGCSLAALFDLADLLWPLATPGAKAALSASAKRTRTRGRWKEKLIGFLAQH